MKCVPIKMDDGTVVLAAVKPGEVLTAEDKKILAEWIQFCRDRRAKEQRRKEREAARRQR